MRWRIIFKDGAHVIIDSADHPTATDERHAVCAAIDQRLQDGDYKPEATEVQRLYDHVQGTV